MLPLRQRSASPPWHGPYPDAGGAHLSRSRSALHRPLWFLVGCLFQERGSAESAGFPRVLCSVRGSVHKATVGVILWLFRDSQDEDCGAAFSSCVCMWDVGFFPGKASCGEYRQSDCAVVL